MIIGFPTALYTANIPQEASESGNITFTISSEDPPRSTETFFQLLRSEEIRGLPPRIYDSITRRLTFDQLIFAVSTGTQRKAGVGTKAYEVGQLLDFDDVQAPDDIDTLNVPDVVELQQNTNLLNYTELGLTNEQVEELLLGANERFNREVASLNITKSAIADKESDIRDNQRLLNETRKALDASRAVFSDTTDVTSGNQIIEQLETKQLQLENIRVTLVDELNTLTIQANEIYNRILDLKEVVR
jgi:hypothetical protein